MIAAQTAHAQAPPSSRLPPGAIVQPLDEGPGVEHRRNLTTLANNPRSVSALIGAGRSAVAMGDGEAALSFFARADEVEPRNPRVKAGMASALVLLERGQAALPLFAEAVALGAPEAEIARDRGLAYDMIGDPRRAQQDYALVLRRGDDPEIRRRMALSLAISGQREAALDMISRQLRQQDRAAWRTQAFVLALTGDTRGAGETASRMMPGAGQSMAPFFARLASLSPAQKAMAVHFGHFPRDGRASASANIDTGADPGALALAQGGIPPAAARPSAAEPESQTAERRRPGSGRGLGIPERPDLIQRQVLDPNPSSVGGFRSQTQTTQPETRRFEPPRPEPDPVRIPDSTAPPSGSVEMAGAGSFGTIAPGFTLVPRSGEGLQQPATSPLVPPEPEPARPEPAPSDGGNLSDIAAIVAALPADEARPSPRPARTSTRPAQRRTSSAEAGSTAQRAASRRPAEPAHPSRRWVQIATVPDRPALAREFARLRTKAPEALRNRNPHSAPYGRSSNRLLVGPFENARAAQDFINQLRRSEVSAFAWTSEAGQEIGRVQTARR